MKAVIVSALMAAGVLVSAPVLSAPPSGADLAKAKNCLSCHAVDKKVVGPAYKDVAAKYKGDASAPGKLATKIQKGGVNVWGNIPMPPNAVNETEALALANWVLGGAK